jgi:hypothetical protein
MARTIANYSDWIFTETVADRGSARCSCALCGQRNLRYHFEVRNRRNGHRMWVGSSCILKFGLAVMQGGKQLPPDEARRKLGRIARRLRG